MWYKYETTGSHLDCREKKDYYLRVGDQDWEQQRERGSTSPSDNIWDPGPSKQRSISLEIQSLDTSVWFRFVWTKLYPRYAKSHEQFFKLFRIGFLTLAINVFRMILAVILYFISKLLSEIFGLLWWLRQLRIHLQCRIPGFNPLNQEDSLGKRIATHSSILAWRIPWTEEPGGLQSMGSQRVRHDWETNTFTFHYRLYTEITITNIQLFGFLKGT